MDINLGQLETGISSTALAHIAEGMAKAPDIMLSQLTRAWQQMLALDKKTFRARYLSGGTGLRTRSKGFRNSWKTFNNFRAKSLSELHGSFYTRAPVMGIFQHGGVITPKKGKYLTVLTVLARKSSRRRWTVKELRDKVMHNQDGLRMQKTKSGYMIVQDKISITKTGKTRKGSRTDIIAYLKPKIVEKKRIDVYANHAANSAQMDTIIEQAVNRTFEMWMRQNGTQ